VVGVVGVWSGSGGGGGGGGGVWRTNELQWLVAFCCWMGGGV